MNMKLLVFIFFNILITGCASFMDKNFATQDKISQPANHCTLQKEQIENIAIYDDSHCWRFSKKIFGICFSDRLDDHTFLGHLSHDSTLKTFSWPIYQIKYPTKYDFSTCGLEYSSQLPDNICVKNQGEDFSIRKVNISTGPGCEEIDEIELIKMPKLSDQKRNAILQKRNAKLRKDFEVCNSHYESLLQKWKTQNNAQDFCNDIHLEWLQRDCKAPWSGECITIAYPFLECYRERLIKLNPAYVNLLI